MAQLKYIYFCEIDRFGYTLQAIGLTEREARQAIIDEYIKTYIKNNGINPRTDPDGRYDYNVFINELYVDKREIGAVVWT